jgi:hypothetical protein
MRSLQDDLLWHLDISADIPERQERFALGNFGLLLFPL